MGSIRSVAIYIDGQRFGTHHVLSALGVDHGGSKQILGIELGATKRGRAVKLILEEKKRSLCRIEEVVKQGVAMTGNKEQSARTLKSAGKFILRYGLVLVIFWVGCLKFTAYEAQGVHAFESTSPLLSWTSGFLDVRSFSRALGVLEITLAVLIATRPFSPKLSAVGSLGAIAMFLTTLSFLLTTPGVWQPLYGFPSLSPAPGQFLAKDLVLLGAAVWTAGEALLGVPASDRLAA